MSQGQKSKIWVMVGLILLTGFFLPIFFGEPRMVKDQHGGDPWRNIIYDFQTLFTGVLAVGAAAFTIIQSRAIDERQQRRHEQLFDLQVRPDRLRLARAWGKVRYLITLKSSIESVTFPFVLPGAEPIAEPYRAAVVASELLTSLTLDRLRDKEVENVRDLFDGQMHNAFNGLEVHLRILVSTLKRMVVNVGMPVEVEISPLSFTVTPYTLEKRREDFSRVHKEREMVLEILDDFITGFEQLVEEYKVV